MDTKILKLIKQKETIPEEISNKKDEMGSMFGSSNDNDK